MSNAAQDAPIGGLRQSAVKGAFITSLAQLAKVIVQFGSVIVLSRLLSPFRFRSLGDGRANLRVGVDLPGSWAQSCDSAEPRGWAGADNALFWLNVAMSLLLAVPLIFGAPMIGWFYGDERVVGLTQGFAAVIVIGALGAQHTSLLNRSMRFNLLAALDALSAFSGFLGAALLAATFHSYWALFAGAAISVTTSVVGAWMAPALYRVCRGGTPAPAEWSGLGPESLATTFSPSLRATSTAC